MANIYERIVDLKWQVAEIELQITELRKSAVEPALASFAENQASGRKTSVVYRSDRAKVLLRFRQTVDVSKRMAELESAIEAEQNRLAEENAGELAAIDAEIDEYQQKIEALEALKSEVFSSPLLADLESQLEIETAANTYKIPELSFHLS
jgi:DNA repair exonuclease SbcCD ATPase subunit